MYTKSLQMGDVNHVNRSLPKLLTLWFSFTEQPEGGNNGSKLKETCAGINETLKEATKKVPARIWFVCISQLVSRAGHPNKKTLSIITAILIKLLTEYPKQGIWHIAGMIHSKDPARQATGRYIVQQALRSLITKGVRHQEDSKMLEQAELLFSNLIQLSQFPLDKGVREFKWGTSAKLSHPFIAKFLLPSQGVLNINLSSNISSKLLPKLNDFEEDHEFIQTFRSSVDVLNSKERPKIVRITTSHGVEAKVFLF